MQKRDISEKILGLIEVFMSNPGSTMSLQNINMILQETNHTPLSRSTFFRLMKKINDEQYSFKIITAKGSTTERGYQLEINYESGNSFSELYKRINTNLYDKMPPRRLFSDDDNHYYSLNPILDKINRAINQKLTLDFDYYDMSQVKPLKIKGITPIYIVVKPNKVWLYYTVNQTPKKCNLFQASNMSLTSELFDHISLNDFKEKYLDKHGYFKEELKKFEAVFDSEEKHVQFHQFLLEQNFQRYYLSWKDKKTNLYHTTFKSLSKDQIKLFGFISNLIMNKNSVNPTID